ncbi:MAG: N-methylhydantoinase B [Bradymonadia bacterium]|jgi:N-methylhydantoinase B
MNFDGIELELLRHRLVAVAEEMGQVLTLAAFSPNIKERRDHSCAVFDERGEMIAQAAHIPVHLGAAPLCVKAVIEALQLADGETAVVNDPFAGGTHLPDITLVTPVDVGSARFFVATRAHHADVGGISPGSLPLSTHIDEEGWRTPPVRLNDAVINSLYAASRTPDERRGDLAAQRASNDLGRKRVMELAATLGPEVLLEGAQAIQEHAARVAGQWFRGLPAGRYASSEVLDDANGDGIKVPLELALTVSAGGLRFDFSRCGDQVPGPMNAVRAIVESAVFYCLICLIGEDAPTNSGLLRDVTIVTRPGSVVDAVYPAAVAAGNVETSQRLVDLVFGAFRQVLPGRVPAAAAGTMNNVLIGSLVGAAHPFVVYETIGGGYGGGPSGGGASAIQVHMTNTLNTPVEALEHAFPLRIRRYEVRTGSGGAGASPGGDGIVREFEALEPCELTVLAERRRVAPPGADGGEAGSSGTQRIVSGSTITQLPGKATVKLAAGDRFVIETPGGGGFGRPV